MLHFHTGKSIFNHLKYAYSFMYVYIDAYLIWIDSDCEMLRGHKEHGFRIKYMYMAQIEFGTFICVDASSAERVHLCLGNVYYCKMATYSLFGSYLQF